MGRQAGGQPPAGRPAGQAGWPGLPEIGQGAGKRSIVLVWLVGCPPMQRDIYKRAHVAKNIPSNISH